MLFLLSEGGHVRSSVPYPKTVFLGKTKVLSYPMNNHMANVNDQNFVQHKNEKFQRFWDKEQRHS